MSSFDEDQVLDGSGEPLKAENLDDLIFWLRHLVAGIEQKFIEREVRVDPQNVYRLLIEYCEETEPFKNIRFDQVMHCIRRVMNRYAE